MPSSVRMRRSRVSKLDTTAVQMPEEFKRSMVRAQQATGRWAAKWHAFDKRAAAQLACSNPQVPHDPSAHTCRADAAQALRCARRHKVGAPSCIIVVQLLKHLSIVERHEDARLRPSSDFEGSWEGDAKAWRQASRPTSLCAPGLDSSI